MSAVSPFRTFGPKKVNGKDSSAAIRMMLQRRAREIHSRQQFETIIAAATHPGAVRALLEPLLRKDLPCCLMAGKGEHTEGCPDRNVEAKAVTGYDIDHEKLIDGVVRVKEAVD